MDIQTDDAVTVLHALKGTTPGALAERALEYQEWLASPEDWRKTHFFIPKSIFNPDFDSYMTGPPIYMLAAGIVGQFPLEPQKSINIEFAVSALNSMVDQIGMMNVNFTAEWTEKKDRVTKGRIICAPRREGFGSNMITPEAPVALAFNKAKGRGNWDFMVEADGQTYVPAEDRSRYGRSGDATLLLSEMATQPDLRFDHYGWTPRPH